MENKENRDNEAPVKERTGDKGLKKMRAATGKAPQYECSNCKCKRYTPCGCQKRV